MKSVLLKLKNLLSSRAAAVVTFLFINILVCGLPRSAFAQETLMLDRALQLTLENYESLKVAGLRLERARQEEDRVKSQLGWTLGGQLGQNRDISIIGEPIDRTDASANLGRKLESGSSVELGASYVREDSSLTFFRSIPNPADTTNLDLSLRKPLKKGADNPVYQADLVSAEAGAAIAEADRDRVRDDLARRTIELFYAATLTRVRMENAERSLNRAKRLRSYIRSNARLGISEKKDTLQAEAQLRQREAELRGLLVAWKQQRTDLNRLMGLDWAAEFVPLLADSTRPISRDYALMLDEVKQNSSDLRKNHAQIRIAEAAMVRARDAHKDNLDLIFSIGNRTRSGPVTGGVINDSDVIGGVRLEYTRNLDKRGSVAEVTQAQLDRDIALEEILRIEEDLSYNLSSLLAEIDATHSALAGYRISVNSEQKKLDEAIRRYRSGRTDTDQLIQFEGDLFAAELLLERQAIELARRHSDLALLRGSLWRRADAVHAPVNTAEGNLNK